VRVNGFLQQAVDEAQRRVQQWRRDGLLERLRSRQTTPAVSRDFAGALRGSRGPAVIAEIKRASPSRGVICADGDAAGRARDYEQGGAAAISVLTEPRWFGGALEDLAAVRAAVTLPLLRKDFVVDEYDLRVTGLSGADAMLLIVACLRPPRLTELVALARSLGLHALVETHDATEVSMALDAGADIIGVNARNLHTLGVDVHGALQLLSRVPSRYIKVLESGVKSRADVEAAVAAGADAVLIGEALMQSADPRAKLRELSGA
jgi:indole-3-glycerol phosphate synthase